MRARHLWIAIFLTTPALCLSTAARAALSIFPAQPTSGDSIAVTVGSRFPSECWHVVGQVCSFDRPETLQVVVDVDYCHGYPGCACSQLPYTYQESCTFGPLPAGSYVAAFAERRLNPSDPEPPEVESVQFWVRGLTPALRHTWGSMKIFYR